MMGFRGGLVRRYATDVGNSHEVSRQKGCVGAVSNVSTYI